jgi:BirA family transcriptional regulator, biotin operon repressor / biotin---[acetyl-CoA-carboxylase] ligase
MLRQPEFPPLIAGHHVGDADPFLAASNAAASGKAGAGDLFWSEVEHQLRAAIVLEPEAREADVEGIHLATMVAIGDCIGALAPPEVGIFYRWPDKICANGAVVGVARFSESPTERGAAPSWLVSGIDVNIRAEREVADPGATPDVTTLWDEGCGEITLLPLLESFARHLNAWIHTFETDGVRSVHEAWMARAEGRDRTVSLTLGGVPKTGTFLGLDEKGSLVLRTEGGTELLALKDALL